VITKDRRPAGALGPRLAFGLLTFSLLLSGTGRASEPRAAAKLIHILLSSTGDQVMFDQNRIRVRYGRHVLLTYRNDAPAGSKISHNVAVVRPGRANALLAVLQDHGYDLASVKGSPDIIAITRTLEPTEQETIDFSPPTRGDYEYVCLMPGHGDMMGMRGILRVK
jgi:azurin